ncbi:MAG TPA: peptidoglycan bridge formation glycyltransferase FemA/FemB family protein [Candidatus Limnocylindrales bacterium]|nr:peptidoglycan bridge formation glycyltransferase FemA/FemB family protein [Candidatus Limnocylindrales bacterium]
MPPIVRRATEPDRPAWDAFVNARPEADILQSWSWGECAALSGEPPVRILVEDAGTVRGVAQVLLRPAGFGRRVAYVAHGPVWDRSAADGDRIFAWLLHGLKRLSRREHALVVKMDPRAEADADFEFGHLAIEHGLRPAPDLQAPTTRIVPLLDGGDELEASWHADARRLMRRAEREGTHVRISRKPDPEEIGILHDLLERTAERADFRVRSVEFLERLATELEPSGGWYLGIARVKGTPIAAMCFPRIGDRAYYLYGALLRDPAYKHNYGSHAVMAAMLKALAAYGCKSVDMWGVVEPDDADADPSWKGFSDFKRTFGGTPLRHPGLFDLVTDPFWYRLRTVRAGILERVGRS